MNRIKRMIRMRIAKEQKRKELNGQNDKKEDCKRTTKRKELNEWNKKEDSKGTIKEDVNEKKSKNSDSRRT